MGDTKTSNNKPYTASPDDERSRRFILPPCWKWKVNLLNDSFLWKKMFVRLAGYRLFIRTTRTCNSDRQFEMRMDELGGSFFPHYSWRRKEKALIYLDTKGKKKKRICVHVGRRNKQKYKANVVNRQTRGLRPQCTNGCHSLLQPSSFYSCAACVFAAGTPN